MHSTTTAQLAEPAHACEAFLTVPNRAFSLPTSALCPDLLNQMTAENSQNGYKDKSEKQIIEPLPDKTIQNINNVKEYECCGTGLNSLQELLNHFEVMHTPGQVSLGQHFSNKRSSSMDNSSTKSFLPNQSSWIAPSPSWASSLANSSSQSIPLNSTSLMTPSQLESQQSAIDTLSRLPHSHSQASLYNSSVPNTFNGALASNSRQKYEPISSTTSQIPIDSASSAKYIMENVSSIHPLPASNKYNSMLHLPYSTPEPQSTLPPRANEMNPFQSNNSNKRGRSDSLQWINQFDDVNMCLQPRTKRIASESDRWLPEKQSTLPLGNANVSINQFFQTTDINDYSYYSTGTTNMPFADGFMVHSKSTPLLKDIQPSKPYKCKVPGCDKSYKNANGLKYHSAHGHPENDMDPPKPYNCTYPGCSKRYKNLNGLKYHVEHSHVEYWNQLCAEGISLSTVPGVKSISSPVFM